MIHLYVDVVMEVKKFVVVSSQIDIGFGVRMIQSFVVDDLKLESTDKANEDFCCFYANVVFRCPIYVQNGVLVGD